MIRQQKAFVETVCNAQLGVLDYDGTFYNFSEEMDRHCDVQGTHAALDLLKKVAPKVPIAFEEALELRIRSYRLHGCGAAEFTCIYGLDREEWHHEYHKRLDASYVNAMHVTKEQLNSFPAPLVILSHASREWIEKTLGMFPDIKEFFPENRIYGLENVGFKFKSNGGEAYRRVLNEWGVAPDRAFMVEDSLANLESAKRVGLTTIYITHGKPFDSERHGFVDFAFTRLGEMLEAASDAMRPSRKPWAKAEALSPRP